MCIRDRVWVNIGLFAFMVVIGTYQILVRYLFNRPSTVSEELLTYAFAWMSLLAATYAVSYTHLDVYKRQLIR